MIMCKCGGMIFTQDNTRYFNKISENFLQVRENTKISLEVTFHGSYFQLVIQRVDELANKYFVLVVTDITQKKQAENFVSR